MLAVPDTIIRREIGVEISTAREKELPYFGAPHCSGDSSSHTDIFFDGLFIAMAPLIIFFPVGLGAPMPVLAGRSPSNIFLSV